MNASELPNSVQKNIKFWISSVLAIALSCAVLWMPSQAGLPIAGQRMLAILVFAVIIWISEVLSYEVSAIVIMALIAIMIGSAPSVEQSTQVMGTQKALALSLSGFANPALLLVASALFIAAAMTLTGLDRRIALITLTRLGASPKRVLWASLLLTVILSFLVPSATARVACVVPILMGVIAAYNLEKKSNLAASMMILVAQATSIWNVAIMTSAAQNLLTLGFMQSILGQSVTWLEWLIAGLPWSILMSVVLYCVLLKVLPLDVGKPMSMEKLKTELHALGRITRRELTLLVVMLILLIVWSTQGKLHSIDTATSTLIGLAVLMIPGIGVMSWQDVQQKIPWGTIVVFGVGISLGTAILKTQAGTWLASVLVDVVLTDYFGLTHISPFLLFAILSAFLIVIHLGFASATALTSAMLPILIAVLARMGGEINVLGMSMLLGFVMSFGFLLPINAPQNMVCIATGTFNSRQFSHTGIYLTLIGYALLLLMAVTWWRWLGLI